MKDKVYTLFTQCYNQSIFNALINALFHWYYNQNGLLLKLLLLIKPFFVRMALMSTMDVLKYIVS